MTADLSGSASGGPLLAAVALLVITPVGCHGNGGGSTVEGVSPAPHTASAGTSTKREPTPALAAPSDDEEDLSCASDANCAQHTRSRLAAAQALLDVVEG